MTAWPSKDVIRAGEQEVTKNWWAKRFEYELRVSSLVVAECEAGDSTAAADRIAALDGIPIMELTSEAEALGAILMREVPLPEKAATDALHVAIAAVNGIEYLMTWNCTHIANAVLRPRIEVVCRKAGYEPPVDLYSARIARGGLMMEERDALADIRAWRDEFARSHGYDLAKMAATLRELDRAAGTRVIRGEPRKPEEVQPLDEWERQLLASASDCGVSLPNSALSSEGIYD